MKILFNMKIGILTFQPSLNYGSILQCLALKRTLESMGHEVSVFRHWRDYMGDIVAGPYAKWGRRKWLRFAIRSLFGLDDFKKWLRCYRTKRFLKKNLSLLPWKIQKWTDAPTDIGIDLIVVGSDQVWHCGDWGDPSPFLLEGAPAIPAIAYSASFGMAEIPQRLEIGPFVGGDISSRYKSGLERFTSISCREAEGVDICRTLGFHAAHVVDPTLLPELDSPKRKSSHVMVCYLMTYSVTELNSHLVKLEEFAQRNRCEVRVFLREWISQRIPEVPLPFSPAKARKWLRGILRSATSRVKLCLDAGPQEFVDAMASARWVVTDSFHGLMLSIRSNCDVRVLQPTTADRAAMFARIGEFALHFDGPLLADSMDAALTSFARGDEVRCDYQWLDNWRSESLAWLKNAVEKVGSGKAFA